MKTKKLFSVLAILVLLLAAMPVLSVLAEPVPKVDVCHREGNGSFHLINVSANAVPAHLAHGDALPGDMVPGMDGKKFDEVCNVVDAGPVVSPGYDSTATILASVTYRALINPGGLNGYEGIITGGMQNDFYRGATCDGSTPYGSWNPVNHVKIVYNPTTGLFTAQIDAAYSYCLQYALGNPAVLDYLQLDVVNRATGTTVNFNNVVLNGYPLGNFVGSGWKTWSVTGLDFTTGFTLEGDLELAWPTPPATSGQETNKLVIGVGYLP
jgi:hypothetical protein